jgi:hypothetical protein
VKPRVKWIILAASICLVAGSARAQHTLTTTTRLNLRSGPWHLSPVKRVLPRHSKLAWDGAMADSDGMLCVAPAKTPRDTGWVAGEFVVEGRLRASHHGACGVLRWPVKTMSDADAAAVNRTPKEATLATLIAFPAPTVRPQDGRANAIEKTEFGVSGNITKWGLESDGDFHLVLADGSNPSQTIVLEVPDTTCVTGATKNVRDSIATVRQEVVRALGRPSVGLTALKVPVPITATGVGFFDFGHATGHPPNAFELHPLLSIRFAPHTKSYAATAASEPRGGIQ